MVDGLDTPRDGAESRPTRLEIGGTRRDDEHTQQDVRGTRRDVDDARDAGRGTRRDDAGGDRGPGTCRDGGVADEPADTGLPPTLRQRFRILEEWSATGAEADLFLIGPRDDPTAEPWVAKIYRSGIRLDASVSKRIAGAEAEHVVTQHECDVVDGRWYELLEYVPLRSLSHLIHREGPVLDGAILRDVVIEMVGALEHLHGLGLTHRDIKPDNILVRTREPRLDLVLADFGLTRVVDDGQLNLASHSRTHAYASPEAAFYGDAGPHRDYWALGIILVEALLGEHPFAGLSEQVMSMHLNTRGVAAVERIEDRRWALLCRGLLTHQPEQRWGGAEVRQWLEGGSPPVGSLTRIGFAAAHPYRLAGVDHYTLASVAVAIAGGDKRTWGLAATGIENGQLFKWAEEGGADQDTLAALSEAAAEKDRDLRVCATIYALDPTVPPVWRGADLSPEGIAAIAAAAVTGRDDGSAYDGPPTIMAALGKHRVIERIAGWTGREPLGGIDARWRTDMRQWLELVKALPSGLPKPDQRMVEARLLRAAATTEGDDELFTAAQAHAGGWTTRVAALRSELPGGSLIRATPVGLLAIAIFGEQLARMHGVGDDAPQPTAGQSSPRDEALARMRERLLVDDDGQADRTARRFRIGPGTVRTLRVGLAMVAALLVINIVDQWTGGVSMLRDMPDAGTRVLDPLRAVPVLFVSTIFTLLTSGLLAMTSWTPPTQHRQQAARLVAWSVPVFVVWVLGRVQQWW